LRVKRFESALDPAEAEGFIDRLGDCQGLPARRFLVKNQPDFDFRLVILLQPAAESFGVIQAERFTNVHLPHPQDLYFPGNNSFWPDKVNKPKAIITDIEYPNRIRIAPLWQKREQARALSPNYV
jgi:hypothetical protein